MPCWNAARRLFSASGDLDDKKPTRAKLLPCCASAKEQSASKAHRTKPGRCTFCDAAFTFMPVSLDYPVRPRQHVRRNREADLLRGFQVDHELELRRLFDGKVELVINLKAAKQI